MKKKIILLCILTCAICVVNYGQRLFSYDLNDANIYSFATDGTDLEQLPINITLSDGRFGESFGIDKENDKIFLLAGNFVIDDLESQLWSSNMDGSDTKIIATFALPAYPTDISIEPIDKKIYWVQRIRATGDAEVWKMNYDGTSKELIYETGVSGNTDPKIVVNAADSVIFMLGGFDQIYHLSLDGNFLQTIDLLNGLTLLNLVYDENNNGLYITGAAAFEDDEVFLIDPDSLQASLLFTSPSFLGIKNIALDPVNKKIYANSNLEYYVASSVDGSDLNILAYPDDDIAYVGFEFVGDITIPVVDIPVSDLSWQIYPNPCTDYITIQMDDDAYQQIGSDVTWAIYDMQGRLVQNINKSLIIRDKESLFISELTEGIYLFAAYSEGILVHIERLVKI